MQPKISDLATDKKTNSVTKNDIFAVWYFCFYRSLSKLDGFVSTCQAGCTLTKPVAGNKDLTLSVGLTSEVLRFLLKGRP